MITALYSIFDPLVVALMVGCVLLRREAYAAWAIFAGAAILFLLSQSLAQQELSYITIAPRQGDALFLREVDYQIGWHFVGIVFWCYVGRAVRWVFVPRASRQIAVEAGPVQLQGMAAADALTPPPPERALHAASVVAGGRPSPPPAASLSLADMTRRRRAIDALLPPPPPPPLPPTMAVPPVTSPASPPAPPPPLVAPAIRPTPQAGRKRQIYSAPVGRIGTEIVDNEKELLAALDGTTTVMMMGDNPALPPMPERPTLLDFFKLRFGDITFRHLLLSAKTALDAGQDEKIVIACLLHDIANGALVRSDHGYWGAQLIAPYVTDEVAWAVQYHQALRYFADESVGYQYPASYLKFFGPDYAPPDYIRRDAEAARRHRWYMSARLVTIYDIYSFEQPIDFEPEIFTDLIGRNFRQPAEGLGFDNSPTAHMWRTMIWPNNFL